MLCPAKMENRIPRKQSSRQMSMSDTESQMETTFHSPEQSPFRDPPPHSKASITVSAVDKFYSPHPSPAAKLHFDRRSSTGNDSSLPSGGYPLISTAPLVLRLAQALFCVISFSLMAADQTQGWTGDSWHRYKEYRYCLAVNVMGFVYSGFQGFNISYRLATNSSTYSALRYHLDFVMDQILAYLLMSASSSAATRVEDWVSNWGKDEFTQMASASIAMSFFAFLAFASSSLASAYVLSNHRFNNNNPLAVVGS